MALLAGAGWLKMQLPAHWQGMLYGVLGSVAALALTMLFARQGLAGLAATGLQWQAGSWKRLTAGLLIGTAMFALLVLALAALSGLRWQWSADHFDRVQLWPLLALLPLSYMEEVAFRGYPFAQLQSAWGLRTTLWLTALVFALYHVAGGQSLAASLAGPGVYAFVFGLGAAWSGGIALPLGIHLALNVWQPLLGFRTAEQAMWHIQPAESPALLAPDTVGLAAQLLILAAALAMTEYYLRRKTATDNHL
jgi:hypothetical protein